MSSITERKPSLAVNVVVQRSLGSEVNYIRCVRPDLCHLRGARVRHDSSLEVPYGLATASHAKWQDLVICLCRVRRPGDILY